MALIPQRSLARRLIAVLLPALICAPGAATAQELVLKRALPPIAWAGCPAAPASAAPTAAARLEAASLAESARQAAILGDVEAARRQLESAVALDPSAPDLAYRLALTLEQAAQPRAAAIAYCRYLALASDATDADVVRGHIADLIASAGPTISAEAARVFSDGVAAWDAGRSAAAGEAFAAARRLEPAWADPAYNLAAVHLAAGDEDAAHDALRAYLEANPAAADFNEVLDLVLVLRPVPVRPYDPGLALAGGLVVPGLGHFLTARPRTGVLVLGSATAALTAALSIRRVSVLCLAPPVDGVCAPSQMLERQTERPYLVAGVGAAAAIGVFGAIDAYRGAQRRNEQAAPPARSGAATDGRMPDVRPPAVRVGPGGLELAVLRIWF
jgi:tetratricopeptide (TPR) repeat protein